MAHGSIWSYETKAGRVYRALLKREGQWVNGWDLTQVCQTTAISTRISEVRQQLPAGEVIEGRRVGRSGGYEYRLVAAAGQMELAL